MAENLKKKREKKELKEASKEDIDCVIRGYSHYKRVWTPYNGQDLIIQHEPDNQYDVNAMAVYTKEYSDEFTDLIRYIRSQYRHKSFNKETDGLTKVGYLPREISRDCCSFTKDGGTIVGVVTGQVRRSDIGKGLEVPCKLTLTQSDRTALKHTLQTISENYEHSYDYIPARGERTMVLDTTGTPYETFGSRAGIKPAELLMPDDTRPMNALHRPQYPSDNIEHDELMDVKDKKKYIKRKKCRGVSTVTSGPDHVHSVDCKKPKLKNEQINSLMSFSH